MKPCSISCLPASKGLRGVGEDVRLRRAQLNPLFGTNSPLETPVSFSPCFCTLPNLGAFLPQPYEGSLTVEKCHIFLKLYQMHPWFLCSVVSSQLATGLQFMDTCLEALVAEQAGQEHPPVQPNVQSLLIIIFNSNLCLSPSPLHPSHSVKMILETWINCSQISKAGITPCAAASTAFNLFTFWSQIARFID